MNLDIKFNDIFDFYQQTDILEEGRRKNDCGDDWESHIVEENKSFRGLSNKEIFDSMYSYKEGLDQLKEIDLEMNQGSNRKIYKWSDQDGDDMSLERLNEQLPFMNQRVNTAGDRNGKFVNLHIAICENASVTYKEMLYRSYCAIQVADYLENNGYKVAIYAYFAIDSVGKYKGAFAEYTKVSIQIKKPEEPLNKGLLLNAISPWFFRYWGFKFLYAKFYTSYGLGRTWHIKDKNSKSDIYLKSQECLSKEEVDAKIVEFKELFNKTDVK